MRRLRTLALAALLTSLSLGPSPASAQTAVLVFTGSADVACFGCDFDSPCNANLTILGVTHIGNAATTYCRAFEFTGALCLISGTAWGTVQGTSGSATVLSLDFTWTRYGAVAVITTSGGMTGFGTGVFIAAGGTTCGAPLNDAIIVGSVVGV